MRAGAREFSLQREDAFAKGAGEICQEFRQVAWRNWFYLCSGDPLV